MRYFFACVFAGLLSASGACADEENDTRWSAVGRLDLGGRGFCTGALISPDMVITAAHCLFDPASGERISLPDMLFLPGWQDGHAGAYRVIERTIIHPAYNAEDETATRAASDLALLTLLHPVDTSRIDPFDVATGPASSATVSIAAYTKKSADRLSMQENCEVVAVQEGTLVTTCPVDFGASGAPVFSLIDRQPHIVSVVTAMAEVDGARISLGPVLETSLPLLISAIQGK